MNVKVHEIMTGSVITAQPHATIAHVRVLMKRNKINSIPVVDTDGHPIGIVSSTDLVTEQKPNTPISRIMTEIVLTLTVVMILFECLHQQLGRKQVYSHRNEGHVPSVR